MNLLLKPLQDVNDVTWSIVISLAILLAGVIYVIYWILTLDERESLSQPPQEVDHPYQS
jgi:hypothetical protein